jgi:hypothetical protein
MFDTRGAELQELTTAADFLRLTQKAERIHES